MHRNLQLGLIGILVATVALVVAIALWPGGSPPAASEATPTPEASTTPGGSPTTGPTASPGPTNTPAPPTPTPTPEPPDAEAMARAILVSQGKATPGDLSLVSYERVTWLDASLGCPEPSESYAQVETPGWRIILDNAGQEVEFHSDDSGETLFNCTERWVILEDAVNVYEIEQLEGTTLIEIERFNFETEAYEKVSEVTDPSEVQNFLDVLNGPVASVAPYDCQPVFQLTFHRSGGTSQISTICGGETRMMSGQAAEWNGQHGVAPPALGDLIGRNLPDAPIPQPPD